MNSRAVTCAALSSGYLDHSRASTPLTSAAAQPELMSWSVQVLPFTASTTEPYVGAATSVAELAATLSKGSVPAGAPPPVAFTPTTPSYPAG